MRERRGNPPLAPAHLRGYPERIDDRFLRRLDRRDEEMVEGLAGQRRDVATCSDGEEDLPASVVGDRAHPRETEAAASSDARELVRTDRGIDAPKDLALQQISLFQEE